MPRKDRMAKAAATANPLREAMRETELIVERSAQAKVGRPKKITPEIVKLLEQAYALDCSDEEACFFAGINHNTLNGYKHEHPEFTERIKQLRQRPVLEARLAVIGSFKRDPNLAMKYLEKKAKKEFGNDKIPLEQGGAMAVLIALGIVQAPQQLEAGDSTE